MHPPFTVRAILSICCVTIRFNVTSPHSSQSDWRVSNDGHRGNPRHLFTMHIRPLRGRIELIAGPMFSGKTTELLRRVQRMRISRFSCVVVKSSKDLRYSDDFVQTHDGSALSAMNTDRLTPILPQLQSFDVVAIDEGQFVRCTETEFHPCFISRPHLVPGSYRSVRDTRLPRKARDCRGSRQHI